MKYLPCEFRQQLGAPIARASSVKTSNIGTLDALAGSVKQPFMQSAAKSDSEPFFPFVLRCSKGLFWSLTVAKPEFRQGVQGSARTP
jgi:hypothetical protein